MVFKNTKAFFTRPYVVDYQQKKVSITGYEKKSSYVFDFIWDYIAKLNFYGNVPGLIVALMMQNMYVLLYFLFVAAVVFLIFNIIYVTFPQKKVLSDLQMMIEAPLHFAYAKKRKHVINIKSKRKVILKNCDYWKYNIMLDQELKRQLAKIVYDKPHPLSDENDLIFSFKRRVSGSIDIELQGTCDDIIVQ